MLAGEVTLTWTADGLVTVKLTPHRMVRVPMTVSAVSKSTSSLSKTIGGVGKPELARLQFTLVTEEAVHNPDLFPVRKATLPLVGHIVTVKLSATALGKTTAKNGQRQLRICTTCTYAEEPKNSSPPDGDLSSPDRRIGFQQIFPGGYMDAVTLKVRVPDNNYGWLEIGCMYACDNCESGHTQPKNAQRFEINLKR